MPINFVEHKEVQASASQHVRLCVFQHIIAPMCVPSLHKTCAACKLLSQLDMPFQAVSSADGEPPWV